MATVEQNKFKWDEDYHWSSAGDEWSITWGGTANLWYGAILPRIGKNLPAKRILEIAPGFGRFTQFLKVQCDELIVVDLAEKCIEACKQRFSADTNLRYHVNDGKSLDMIEDGELDFVFSFDSLVHAEREVLDAYVSQLGRKLSVGGRGFIHHSNLASMIDPVTGKLPYENIYWRAESMCAALFREQCKAASLVCVAQEIVTWGQAPRADTFSYFCRLPEGVSVEARVRENPNFMHEAESLRSASEHFILAASSADSGPGRVPDCGVRASAMAQAHVARG